MKSYFTFSGSDFSFYFYFFGAVILHFPINSGHLTSESWKLQRPSFTSYHNDYTGGCKLAELYKAYILKA